MPERLDHVGFVVHDIKEAAELYSELLGLTLSDRGIVEDTKYGVRLGALPIGDSFIELLQPMDPGNRFGRFLRERGEGLFHLAIFINNYDEKVRALRDKGIAVEEERVNQPFPGHTLRLAWLPPESTRGIWIELVDIASLPESMQ